MIDRETVDRIYAAANIVDIIGEYVTLKRKGVNYTACCPFHNEKTPSFIVSPAKGLYKCFGCGKGGNAVTFVMEQESCSYPEALKMVAKRYGIEVHEKEMTEEEVRRNDDRESMFALNSWMADYFSKYLHDSTEGQSIGLSYFRMNRGMTDATIRKFGLGFCPTRGDQMTQDALKAGYKEEFLLSTGLSLKSEHDGRLRDRFRDRVMFPIHNISGRVVGFGGRTLRTDKSVAKYQNSPESEIYSKKRELYGLYFAKKAIQQQEFAILVEGYTDVISMHQAGVENVVASSGTSLTTEQIRLLGRFTRNITVIYDGDSAGIHASLRGIDMILKEGLNVRVVLLPEPEDPDSFARSHTAEELQKYILDNEQDFLEFKARLLLKDAAGDPIKKAGLIGDMVQSIAQIPDSIQRSVYIKECARTMDVDEQILVSEVARKRLSTTGDRETDDFLRRQMQRQNVEKRETETEFVKHVEAGSGMETLERELVKYLLKYGHRSFEFKEGRNMVDCNVAEAIFTELGNDNIELSNPLYNKIMETYHKHWMEMGVGTEIPLHLFLNHSDPEVCNLSVDILTTDDNYVPSQLWSKKDVHIESDEEMLAVGVPKAVTLYKSKVVEGMIKELQSQLLRGDLDEEAESNLLQNLVKLNQVKLKIANKLERSIL